MADSSRASVQLDVRPGVRPEPAKPQPDDPFRIVLIGDFGGHANRADGNDVALARRRPIVVDRDDLDEVLARMRPRLALELDGDARVELAFAELDDFHPDRLFMRAPFFQSLREARRRLADPGSFRDTLDSILGESAPAAPAAADAADDVVADIIGGGGSLLERVVGGEQAAAADPLQRYLRRIVAPHVVPGSDPAREAMLSDIDAAAQRDLRRVMRHPAFRALEALWRGVDFLVRRLETGTSLKVHLLDATPAELAADLAGAQDAGDSVLAATLRDFGVSAIAVDAAIGATDDGVALARGLAGLGAWLGAPVLAGAAPDLIGLPALEGLPDASAVSPWDGDAWHALRRSADAAWLGLVLPRFLLRVPYGDDGEPCDRVEFEELSDPPQHEEFTWGNGAIAAALLLGEAFTDAGWRMRPGSHLDVARLPVHTFRGPDGPEIVPCAECLMTDRLAETILEAGPMVLATIRHGDTARLVRFQSVAAPPRALQGPWNRAD